MAACLATVLLIGILVPESPDIPVANASVSDWNKDSYWFEPWGASGVHKGIDIFAPAGRPVVAATGGIVIFSGTVKLGGNVIIILGPKWRFHYYAHLQQIQIDMGNFVVRGRRIGTVGNSGNAQGKPTHLHYVILSAIPYPWRIDSSAQGWKKMFYLNPDERLRTGSGN